MQLKNIVIIVLLALVVLLFYALVVKEEQKTKPQKNDSAELLQATQTKQSEQDSVAASNAAASHGETHGQTIHWKLVTTWPKGFPGLGTSPEDFAEMVRQMSNGRLNIKVFGAKEIVPALGVFDAVSKGSVEAGHGAAYYWKGKIPASVFFTTVPFGMTAQEMNAWLYQGGGLELWAELYQPFDVLPLAGGNTGVQMAGWFNKEINSLDDVRGLIMRIPGLAGEVFSRVGGQAVNIPGGDLYTSLKTGVIDATEWVGPYNDLSMGFHEVAKYYYYPGWHEPGPTLELIVNKSAFEALPSDLQAIVKVAAKAANQAMLDEYIARNNAALDELVNQHGVVLKRLPDEVLKAFQQETENVLEEMSAKDASVKKIYSSYKAFAKQAKDYHKISEEAYMRARGDD
jgi:TRAP-type mannitol/chloroaromatic compound transport system substrate-binding protein